jgi:predicted permease
MTPTPTPPALPRALLLRALGESAETLTIEGDLLEDFTLLAARKGERAARRRYWYEAITLSVSYAAKRMADALKPQHQPRTWDRTMANTLGTFGLTRDLRYALRAVRREPGFFAFAVLIIGIGVGACTAVFSVINPLMLRSLPFHEPDQLVWIANSGDPRNGMSAVTSRTSNLRDFRNLSESFEGITGYNAFFGQGRYNLIGGGEPERLVGAGVARDFLEVLGVNPLHGRNFVAEEGVYNGRPAVILTNGFWRRRFGGDPTIVGTSININGTPTNVVGVLPHSFNFASIFAPSTHIDFLLPWPISDETDRQGNTTSVIGRLKPGVTVESAQAELDVIVAGLQEQYPDRWGLGAAVSPLQAKIAGAYRTGMVVLAAAAGTVMLIVCVNLSNLLLAKGPKRSREMAVRGALGASRFRMLRQLIVESVVLTFGGAAIGVGTAVGATRLVASSTGLNIPMLRMVSVDGQALLFTLGLAIVAGLVMGIVPALHATHAGGAAALNDLSRGSSAGKRSTRLREGLVIVEMAMACLLLVFAGLFLKSFRNLLDVELGFQPTNAVGWTLSTNRQFENIGEMTTFFDQVVQRVEAVPGVEIVGLIDALPLGRNRTWGTIRAPDAVYDDDELQSAFTHIVDHRYLAAMQIPLVAGRNFTPDDNLDGPDVVILNESAAKGVFQGQDAVGRTARIIGRDWQVVGVVADVRHQSLEQTSGWQMYFPFSQIWDFQTVDMLVRSRLPVETLVPGVATALREIDSTMPTDEYQSLSAIVDRSVSPRRFILLLLSAFGGTALLLAALGIYGVLSYSVAERIPEIGIRMALGESGPQLRRRVVGKTMALAGTGVAIGAGLSFVGTRWIGALLYGVEPTDPFTFAGMAIILLVTSALAGYIPARRASKIDPTTAFRSA